MSKIRLSSGVYVLTCWFPPNNCGEAIDMEESRQWDGPHTPVIKPLLIATIHWRNMLKRDRQRHFKSLVKLIVTRRRKQYRTCQFCEELTPLEWLHDDQTCQGCAERHLGVVH